MDHRGEVNARAGISGESSRPAQQSWSCGFVQPMGQGLLVVSETMLGQTADRIL